MSSDILILLTVIFNAGGFVWIARNHMAHVNKTLENLTDRVGALEVVVARIESRCILIHKRQLEG